VWSCLIVGESMTATMKRRAHQTPHENPHHRTFFGNSSRDAAPVIAEDREHDAGRTCWWEGSQTEL